MSESLFERSIPIAISAALRNTPAESASNSHAVKHGTYLRHR